MSNEKDLKIPINVLDKVFLGVKLSVVYHVLETQKIRHDFRSVMQSLTKQNLTKPTSKTLLKNKNTPYKIA